MINPKTNWVGILKIVGVVLYVVYKLVHGGSIDEKDVAIIGFAMGGGVGNIVSADAKPKEGA